MALKPVKQIVTEDRLLNQVQSNVTQAFKQITNIPLLDGKLISDVSITSGTAKTVNHGLGRTLQGWFITKKNANADVWDSQSSNSFTDKTLVLNASSNVTVSLWVF